MHKIPLIFLFSLFLSSSVFPVLFDTHFFYFNPSTATVLSKHKYEGSFGPENFHGDLNTSVKRLHVKNEALVQIYCYLYPKSTNKIILRLEPTNGGTYGWNVTHIDIGIGQEINVTVTNGVTPNPYPGDLYAFIELFVQLENETDQVWGTFTVWILDRGWDYHTPWSFIPGVIALLFIYLKRSIREKKSHK